MAIDREKGVRRTTVGDLLGESLFIPPYQRPYSWDAATAVQLLDDIREAFQGSNTAGPMDDPVSPFSYMLGSVILHWDEEEQRLNIVDGQQRLLTLAVLLELLESRSAGRDLAAAP